MVNLPDAILALVPAATFGPGGTVTLADRGDGNGPVIVAWDDAALGPQPTPEQLAAVTPAQVAAYYEQRAQAAALALLADPGATGTALRAVYLAAGLTAAQVQAQLPAASRQKR
jgi:hypothetical protein